MTWRDRMRNHRHDRWRERKHSRPEDYHIYATNRSSPHAATSSMTTVRSIRQAGDMRRPTASGRLYFQTRVPVLSKRSADASRCCSLVVLDDMGADVDSPCPTCTREGRVWLRATASIRPPQFRAASPLCAFGFGARSARRHQSAEILFSPFRRPVRVRGERAPSRHARGRSSTNAGPLSFRPCDRAPDDDPFRSTPDTLTTVPRAGRRVQPARSCPPLWRIACAVAGSV